MSDPVRPRQRRKRMPVSTPLSAEEMATVDKAAAIRDERRAQFIRRVAVREARAELRRIEREREQEGSAASAA